MPCTWSWVADESCFLGKKLEMLTPNFSLIIWSRSWSCSFKWSMILSRCLMLNSARCSRLLMSSFRKCSSCCCFFSNVYKLETPALATIDYPFSFYDCSTISSLRSLVWFDSSCHNADFFSWFSSIVFLHPSTSCSNYEQSWPWLRLFESCNCLLKSSNARSSF